MKSPPDTSKLERMILEHVLKSLAEKPPVFSSGRGMWVYLGIAIVAGFALSWLDLPFLDNPLIRAFEPLFALLFGMFFMYMFLRSFAKAQWFFLRSFVDRAGIEARLRELGA